MRPYESVRVELLGGARIRWRGVEVALDAWPRRAAELVELLALAGDRHRLLRDQVLEALWPHLDAAAGAANLRKAAHHARRALGAPDAVVLRGGVAALFPDTPVETDVARFEHVAEAALRGADAERCAAAADLYAGDLLPGALYAEWTQDRRTALRLRHRELLRGCGRWERLVADDPTDESAYQGLMRAALDRGDRASALRWYGRLRSVLERELGVLPAHESEALHDECVAGLRPAEPELVGRALERARAEAALDGASRGEVGALVVRGTAGLGKTAVCRRVAATARERGWTVTAVTAVGRSAPYSPLVAVVERVLARERDLLDRLPERTRSVLAELTALAAPAPPLEGGLTRHQVIGALRRVLDTDGTPALVVIDDAHRADDATLDVLLHLAGDAAGDVLVVLAHRPGPAPEALERGVARLVRAGTALTVDLAPLDREDAGLLVRTAARGTVDVDAVVDRAGGNPFFLHELARRPAGSAWQAVAERFVDLDADALDLVERLAVAGDDLGPAEAVAVAELPESRAGVLLDAALDADVLVVDGARYRFRHDLVRQALVERVPPHRRVGRHREIARALATVDGRPAAVAEHWLAGGRPDEAVPFLLTAGQRAVDLGAYRDALGHLDRLLAHDPRHGRALFLRAEALEALGDDRAPAAFAAAARVTEGPAWHDVRARQALASVRAGRPQEALDALDGVQADSLDGRLAHALALCGAAAMGRTDPELGVAKAVETRRLAVASGDPAAVVIASWAEAAAAHARGDLPATVLAGLRETYALPQLAITVFDGQLCVVERLLYGGRPYPELIAFADALEAEAERLGAARGRAFAATFRGEAKLLTGRLDEAEDDLVVGERRHREIGATAGAAVALQRRAEAALYRGDRGRAEVLLDEALTVARESSIGFHLLDRIYGTRIAAAPDAATALVALDEAESAVQGARETCPGCRIALAVPAAIAAAGAGDIERADGYRGTVEALTTILMRLPGWYAALDEVRGHRERAAGDLAAASRHFAAAAARFRTAGHPLDADRCDAAARRA
ncbi:ATP-binding protein [Actinomycetospora cinnamomea]|uniref:DNA-binding SARP family transcriptional activator n=1 Tax=Actinomycetospora cinnamomea TaxID=663609 RepID=A0A2U1F9L0_9PSEU|nr:AAA family ATPase [Actinomycetospora cinnamomea]PVZ08875.1 DNA-binding SARP family transcriptional activator [Actinomycetospora cinnamomea]